MTGDSHLHGRASERAFEKRLALPAYIEELSKAPWIWGECDCTMAVAAWIKLIIGIDPLSTYRGRYHSPSEAKRTARLAGGFLPAIGELLKAAGLVSTKDFEIGDVAAVNPGASNLLPVVGSVLAIRCGNLWLCKAPRGVIARDFPVIAGWRL
jgi:Domain of unknown function (DUF6950)